MQPRMDHFLSYDLFPGEPSKGDRERWNKRRMLLVLGFVYVLSGEYLREGAVAMTDAQRVLKNQWLH